MFVLLCVEVVYSFLYLFTGGERTVLTCSLYNNPPSHTYAHMQVRLTSVSATLREKNDMTKAAGLKKIAIFNPINLYFIPVSLP